MICPQCGKPMAMYKIEPRYSYTKKIEYKREFFRCEENDVWGQLETPVGPMKEFEKQRAPSKSHH